MGKVQPYGRRRLRVIWREFLRENWQVIGIVAAGFVGLAAATSWFSARVLPGGSGYWIGFTHASLAAVFIGLIGLLFLVVDGSAIHQLRGAWGEDNTRDVLGTARRKRLIWGSVDAIDLVLGDIDHVVVTRNAGVVVIDSKWRSDGSGRDARQMAAAGPRAKRRTEGVIGSILTRERGGHRATTRAVDVTPLIVVWGRAQRAISADARVDDVEVVRGRDLLDWLKRAQGEHVERDAAAELIGALETCRATAGK